MPSLSRVLASTTPSTLSPSVLLKAGHGEGRRGVVRAGNRVPCLSAGRACCTVRTSSPVIGGSASCSVRCWVLPWLLETSASNQAARLLPLTAIACPRPGGQVEFDGRRSIGGGFGGPEKLEQRQIGAAQLLVTMSDSASKPRTAKSPGRGVADRRRRRAFGLATGADLHLLEFDRDSRAGAARGSTTSL